VGGGHRLKGGTVTHIVILGAGIGGLPPAYEMRSTLRRNERITVVSNTPSFHLVPSNPWVAVNWRGRDKIVGIVKLESS
jgi:sulfide:quinone oxidoreductase